MPYPQRLLSPDEVVIIEFRPHWSRVFKELVLSFAVVVVLILLATVLDVPTWVMIAVPVVLVLLVARGILSWWFTQHVITNERVIYRAGITSKSGKEIPLEVVNDVSFSQTMWERMIASGDLLIESAGEQGQSHYRDIPKPEDMQRVIYGAREERILHLERGGVAAGGHAISKAQQLEILARLHDEGKLTDAEFEAEKRALGEAGA